MSSVAEYCTLFKKMAPGVLPDPGRYGVPEHGTSIDMSSVLSELLNPKARCAQRKFI